MVDNEVIKVEPERNQDLIDLLNLWKQQHVFRGTIEERKAKFLECHALLTRLFNKPYRLTFGEITEETEKIPGASANSYHQRSTQTINLSGRLSVITLLHEWGHALGMNEEDAQKFAWIHFKEAFPKSASRLIKSEDGVMFVKKEDEQ
jgi:hypothetical protein